MRIVTLLLAPALALTAAACTSRADLAYAPPATRPALAHPVIAAVHVADERGAADPRNAGAVIGSDGKPLKRLETPGTVADAVAQAFHDALALRGDLAPAGRGRYDLDVSILALSGEQWAERRGAADLLVRLIDRTTGREAYSARTGDESWGDNFLAMDNFELGSPAELSRVADAALNRAINFSLDRTGFLLALR